MLRRRLTTAILVTVSAGLVVAVAASCSSFGSADTSAGVAEASTDGTPQGTDASVGPTSDAATDADAAITCGKAIELGFEPPVMSVQGFGRELSKTGADAGYVAAKGVDGGGAFEVVLSLTNASNDGPYALLTRSFDLPDLSLSPRIELSFDYTAPMADGLFVANGCTLSFRSTAVNVPRTDIGMSWSDVSSPTVNVKSTLADGGTPMELKRVGQADANLLGFSHLALKVDLAPDGKSGVAHSTNTGGDDESLSFPLAAVPVRVVVACGMYADSAAFMGLTAYTDNVRFAICSKK